MTLHTTRGFSLIELLFSVAIIMVLYLIMLGPGSKYGQARRKAVCAVNLAQMHMSLSLFAAEHDGAYPIVPGATSSEAPLSELVPKYTTDTNIFICPGSKDAALPGAQPFAERRISYAYYMGLRRDSPPDAPLVSDEQCDVHAKRKGDAVFSNSGKGPGNNHRGYGGNVLFVDGHVETGDAIAAHDLAIPAGVVLLNPKP
ncbi:MAG TPA: type II secretion system protein [Chthoniobacterales bacterium]|nr:type II secretion system protein [Chthoniobacterales bacterium]